MTLYILESVETPGTYYVSDEKPLTIDKRHTVNITRSKALAKAWDFATLAIAVACKLPGQWRTVAIEAPQVAA